MSCYDLVRDVHLSNFQAFEQSEIVRQRKIVIDWGMVKIHVCACVAKEKNLGEINGEIKGKRNIMGMDETELQGDGRGTQDE